ncbi:transmembrane kinase-like 1 [Actinidia rufa]|uniref:Transmembrane kinase-like 1 n=1 Tax=Actinidia rufa TaxID=165716 RepID=A0A7J0F0T5_9ERIC|nr:transmembrane kinase-like 1 [Actinidia rufa]
MLEREELYPSSRGMVTGERIDGKVEALEGGELAKLSLGRVPERRWRDGSLERERLVHCGEDRSVQRRGVALEKTHLRPRHWQRGTEVFHEDRRRFSILPCSVDLFLVRKRSRFDGEDGDFDGGGGGCGGEER